MTLNYDLLDGPACADMASVILSEAWTLPGICYTAEYLKWQLGFPGPSALRAMVAFDGNEPAGFAGASWRRMRCGSEVRDVALVSFVAVRPFCRRRGIAAGLYRHLLGFIRQIGVPVITFAIAGSAGETILLRSYADAGFRVRSLGAYPKYACLIRHDAPPSNEDMEFRVCTGDPLGVLPDVVSSCASDKGILWNDPAREQIQHYLQDPRPRVLLTARSPGSAAPQAAWSVRLDFRSAGGEDTVTAMDTVWLPRSGNTSELRKFASKAAVWNANPSSLISLPSLYGYEGNDLRRVGIRQTGMPFNGYYCDSGSPCLTGAFRGTNLEIV